MELVILSSSPPKFIRHGAALVHIMSSSPTRFPSPNALVQTLRSDNRTAPLSTSAANPLRPNTTAEAQQDDSIWDFPAEDTIKEDVAKAEQKAPNGKAPPKPRAKKVAILKDDNENGETPPKKPRKPRVKKSTVEEGNTPVVKEKAIRKPRAKKVDTEGQTKIPKGRVTKAPTVAKRNKKDDTVSAHFAKSTSSHDFIDIDDISDGKDLNLQEAVKRRTDWTPPRATMQNNLNMSAIETSAVETSAIEDGDVELDATKSFTDLFGSFVYSKTGESVTSTRDDPVPARKRKLIELIKTNATAVSIQLTPKAKTIKKKAKTITERATSAYALNAEEEMEPTPFLQYFGGENTTSGTSSGIGSKSRKRSLVKKASKSKKEAPPPPVLLSPVAALELANRQEFIFGTSSQLAREEDNGFLRDLHQAMHLSNQLGDPFSDDLPPLGNVAIATESTCIKTKPSLWEVASMIEEEGYRDVEVLDLCHSSQVEIHFAKTHASRTEAAGQYLPTPEAGGDWYRLDDVSPSTQADNNLATASNSAALVEAVVPSYVAPIEPSGGKTSSQPGQTSGDAQKATSQFDKPMELSRSAQCPDFESYSTAQLANEIASYKFKPIKKREQMISLLERCWKGKQKTALGAVGGHTLINKTSGEFPLPQPTQNPEAILVASPPMPRGRPQNNTVVTASVAKRKTKTKTVRSSPVDETETGVRLTSKRRTKKPTPVPEEISDSDTPPAPSPPRRRASQIRSPPPLPLVTDDIENITVPLLSPSSQERELFTHITKAVTTAPRSTNPQVPSWYEKILMYDPILLEDLTRWLNTEGLGTVGYDGEAQAVQVKAWCRSKSICCLWKESSRSKSRIKKIGRDV